MTFPYDPVHPNEAADLLGVTVDDVYEQIRRGELAVVSADGRWMVILDRPAPPTVTHAPPAPEPTYTAQPVDYRDELDQIRTQLQSLEEAVRSIAVVQTTQPPLPVPERPPPMALAPEPPANRRGWQGLIVLGVIVSLALAGSMVQSSSAQRSDDLTVVFVFVAGIVTGAIASWLALERRQPADSATSRTRSEPYVPRRSPPVSATPRAGDSDT